MQPEKSQTISFADFEIDARQRQLFRFGKAVSLNAKAFDLLLFLAEKLRSCGFKGRDNGRGMARSVCRRI